MEDVKTCGVLYSPTFNKPLGTFYVLISNKPTPNNLLLRPGRYAQAGVDRILRESIQSPECRREMMAAAWKESYRTTFNPGSRIVDLLRSYLVGFSFVSWTEAW
jgi:hypothetical protein